MKKNISTIFFFSIFVVVTLFLNSCIPMKPLESPANLRILEISENYAKIQWDYFGSYDGFEVQRKVEGGQFEEIATTKETYFEDNDLQPDTTYYYRIRAYKKLNKSPWSSLLDLITLEDQLKSPTITEIYFDESERKIKIRWNDSNRSEEAFEIRKRNEFEDYQIIAHDIQSLEFEDTNFLEGLTYQYQVRAKRGDEYSDWSEPSSVIIDLPIPGSVKNLKIDSITPTSVKISWDCDIEYVTEFEIFRESEAHEMQNLGRTSNKQFLDNTVEQDKEYIYKVYAVRGISRSYSPAQVLAIVPPNITLPSVDDFKIISWGTNYVKLGWSYGDHGQEGFEIYRREGNYGNYELIARVSSRDKYFTDSGLKSFTRYYYKMRAYNSEGFSDWTVQVTTVTRDQ